VQKYFFLLKAFFGGVLGVRHPAGFCLHASREPSASRFLQKAPQKLLVVKRF